MPPNHITQFIFRFYTLCHYCVTLLKSVQSGSCIFLLFCTVYSSIYEVISFNAFMLFFYDMQTHYICTDVHIYDFIFHIPLVLFLFCVFLLLVFMSLPLFIAIIAVILNHFHYFYVVFSSLPLLLHFHKNLVWILLMCFILF